MKRGIRQVVTESIHTGKRIRVIVHTPDECLRLRRILTEILRRRGCEELLIPLYTCQMELLNNALKANYKSVYFEDYDPSKKGSIDYPTALKLFKLEIGRKEHILQKLADSRKLSADVIYRLLDDTLQVTVENHLELTPDEYRNITRKFENARSCRSLTDYFILNEHDPFREGAGLGLVLVMMILKSLGMPNSALSIRSADGITAASIIVPLNEQTLRSYREKILDLVIEKNHSAL